MKVPGVLIECLQNPAKYSQMQIELACHIAQKLNRGKLVLLEAPER